MATRKKSSGYGPTGAGTKAKSKKADSPAIPPKIFAQASPRSIGGISLFESENMANSATVANFLSEVDVVNRAAARLQDAGFEVLQVTRLTINIAGSAATYRKAFDATIVAEERPVIKEGAEHTTATFLECPETPQPGLIATRGTAFDDVLEGVAIEEPRYFMAPPSMFAPLKSYWHLRLPADVSLALNADRVHRSGITGKGVRVVQVDSGWFKHPYFVGRGYRSAPVVLGPSAADPLKDESGHGTGESANIFAVAPDVEFQMVKMNFVNSIGAFNAAVALNPQIITCSWGSSTNGPLSAADQALAAAIAAAVASKIVVVFSAGNGHAGFPGQHPDVISAGGVFMNPDETLQASNYASGFMSQIYPGRRVPDVCGLVGMKPKAIYLMLPLEPNDDIDVGNAGGSHPNGDETTDKDGWAAFSGTSAAAPQLAGVAALIKEACPKLQPADVRDIMRKTARDVTTGNCNSVPGTGVPGGHPATAGPDLATGDGLVDAHKAVMVAKVRCIGPISVHPQPIPPVPPTVVPGPIPPTVVPGPIPPRPIPPILPQSGAEEAAPPPTPPADEPAKLSAEDVASLEDMIINSDLNLE